MHLDPDDLDIPSRYKLLIGAVVPRPIAFVSTISKDGRTNLAPFSFFNAIGASPMTLLFCPANKPDGTPKDSLINADPETGTGQFVVNTASEPYIRKVAAAAEPLDYGDSEFDLTHLTPAPSTRVAPPRLAESPISFECETIQIIRTNPGAPAGGNIVIGRVVYIHACEDLINDRFHVDPDVLASVGRMGGLQYTFTRDRFTLPMGRPALDEPQPTPHTEPRA
jgi:flavin reductase (DIM6/NTAB) family NADH-FMN oxidoreductase RutF